MSKSLDTSNQLFKSPFSKGYWSAAAKELSRPKILVFAAMMIALRVALKSLGIPIAADLQINVAFFVNALSAMVCGPVVAMIGAAVSDTLGCLLFPTGVYFFPFILTEIAGSLIFALFLYRTNVTPGRVIWSRFCICFFVNIVLNTPIMMVYYELILGKSYMVFQLPRIVKNLALFPVEALLLSLFLRAVYPICAKAGFGCSDIKSLKFTKKSLVLVIILLLFSIGTTFGYVVYSYNTTSLSASYGSTRMVHNNEMRDIVLSQDDTLNPDEIVVVVESAYPSFGSQELTYTVGVYAVDTVNFAAEAQVRTDEVIAEGGEDLSQADLDALVFTMDDLYAYSKTPAQNDELLTRVGTATIVTDKDSGDLIQFAMADET